MNLFRKIKEVITSKRVEFLDGVYYGEIKKGLCHGYGTYRFNNGNVCEGRWEHGSFVNGVYTWACGDYYEGDFYRNQKCGFGTYYYKNGEYMRGIWIANKFVGPADNDGELQHISFNDGSRYYGTTIDGCPHGKGTLKNGDLTYVGIFEDGDRSVYGFERWRCGHTYEGEFSRDKRNGYGIYTFKDGSTWEGTWSDDQYLCDENTDWFIENGVAKHRHELSGVTTTYYGDLYYGVPDGDGVAYGSNKTTYDGEWQRGSRTGYGVMIWADGTRYEGTWKDDLPYKQGTMTYKGGAVLSGLWNYSDNCYLAIISSRSISEGASPEITVKRGGVIYWT